MFAVDLEMEYVDQNKFDTAAKWSNISIRSICIGNNAKAVFALISEIKANQSIRIEKTKEREKKSHAKFW